MGKIVIITGASSGMGKVTADYLSQQGHTVFGTCRNPPNYPIPDNYSLIALDLTEAESIENFVAYFRNNSIVPEVLINNAGVGITGPAEELPIATIRAHFETNFFGPIALTQGLLPLLRKADNGCIVNITSIAAYSGLPFRAIYSASKSAFSIFTEALRMELRKAHIRVATIAPGDYATNIASRRHHAPVIKDSPYETVYSEALSTMNAHVDDGSDPIEIAKTIEKIIFETHPKVHYLSGKRLQKFSVVLKGIIPGKWYEKLLRNHYKI
jgi:short-subunit dehydrogenase